MILKKIKSYFLLMNQGLNFYDKLLLAILLPLNKFFNFSFKTKIHIKNEFGIFKVDTPRNFYAYNILREKDLRPFFTLNKNEVFIDVGANVGKYSFFIANRNQDSKIIAIEPDKRNVLVFQENLKLNNIEHRVKIVEKAVFCRNESKKLFINIDNHEKNTIYEEEIMGADKYIGTGKKRNVNYKTIVVEAVTLDSIADNLSEKIGLIKLDIQGAELDALQGAEKILSDDKPNIIFESWNEDYFEEIRDFLKRFSYKITKIDGTNYFAYC